MAETEQTEAGGEASPEATKESTESLAARLYPGDAKDQAAADNKPGETESKNAEAAAAPYNLKIPEGTPIDGPLMNEFTAWGRENNFTDAQMQRAAEIHLKAVGTYAKEAAEFREMGAKRYDEVQAWVAEVNRDPEFGGARVKETVGSARQVLNTFGTPAEVQRLSRELNRTGIGDHPDLIRILARARRALGSKARSNAGKTLAQRLYPGQK